ncbi:hypothetical protein C8R45DRAFT_1072822 [Mycena sanguinolenta]|nr:hypothetical protein C8R45DRAFT_1072822 [Mycena sanguinolenta]
MGMDVRGVCACTHAGTRWSHAERNPTANDARDATADNTRDASLERYADAVGAACIEARTGMGVGVAFVGGVEVVARGVLTLGVHGLERKWQVYYQVLWPRVELEEYYTTELDQIQRRRKWSDIQERAAGNVGLQAQFDLDLNIKDQPESGQKGTSGGERGPVAMSRDERGRGAAVVRRSTAPPDSDIRVIDISDAGTHEHP